MLLELRVENLVLIESAALRLDAGLNVITGETGAGKTVLTQALNLLLGGRPSSTVVRPGAEEAYVEGTFAVPGGLWDAPELAELRERVPDDEPELVLARRVSAAGRSRAFVGGRSAAAGDLQALGSRLLSFCGQHEHRRLTVTAAQTDILDGWAGPDQQRRRAEHRRLHTEIAGLRRDREQLADEEGARERTLDLLRYELGEIDKAGPDPDEHLGLAAERETLLHAERLRLAAARAAGLLGGDEVDPSQPSVVGAVAQAEAALADVAGISTTLDEVGERLGRLALEAEDALSELRGASADLEADPQRLAEVEQRLSDLDRLLRKHGGTIEAVLAHADECRRRIGEFESADERLAEIDGEIVGLEAERAGLAAAITDARVATASRLEEGVTAALADLGMDGARVEAALEPHPDGHGPLGAERVEIRVAPNPGLPLTPLRDTASGGELSRIMLALTGSGPGATAATMVFDEIDAGVGGTTARLVGERLRGLAQSSQVLCITHLPQVASLADRHFRIAKHVADGATVANVSPVEGEALVSEIRRMLGADEGDSAAERHARELLAA
ncbi:MAG: DNA repair protein RecN [Solirubrobacterales bacterium]